MEQGFKLGMGQLLVEGGKVDENLGRAKSMISRAANAGCSLVVLPECLDFGWTHPSAAERCEEIPGDHSGIICSSARRESIYVVAGLTERCGSKIYNSAILVSPEGDILIKHRKINVLSIAQDLYSVGDRLMALETPLGMLGISICADNFPDSLTLAHSLARMGCNLLLSPSAWAVDADYDNQKKPYGGLWKTSYKRLADLYDMTTVGVSCVGWMTAGPWEGRKCIGCSLAVGPGGDILAQGSFGSDSQELITTNLNPSPPPAHGTGIANMLEKRGYSPPGLLGDDGYYMMRGGGK